MYVGSLREHITIQRPQSVESDSGASPTKWADLYARVRASIVTVSSRQEIVNRQATVTRTHIVKMRRATGIDETCRILWHQGAGPDRTLRIVGVIETERGRAIELTAAETGKAT